METERLSERILSGLAQARRDGKQLGRPKGTVKTDDDLSSGLSIGCQGFEKETKHSPDCSHPPSLCRYGSTGEEGNEVERSSRLVLQEPLAKLC